MMNETCALQNIFISKHVQEIHFMNALTSFLHYIIYRAEEITVHFKWIIIIIELGQACPATCLTTSLIIHSWTTQKKICPVSNN